MEKHKGWLVLIAAVVIQTGLGGLYAWSVFVPSLSDDYGLTATGSQLIFGTTIAVFTLTMVQAGRLMSRLGARRIAMTGGVLYALGFLLAAGSSGRLLWLLLGIGVLGGAGTGCGYVSALTSAVAWFPKHKGAVTGVAVAGFGGGAILLSQGVARLLDAELSVLEIFGWMAPVYGGVVVLGGLMLFRPPSGGNATRAALNWTDLGGLVRDRRFVMLALGLFIGTFAGLLTIGNLKPIALAGNVPLETAVLSISLFAVGNTVGRIVWGWLSDLILYMAVPASLGMQAIALAGLPFAVASPTAFLIFSLAAGFGFGACFVVYASQCASVYGADSLGRVYPLIFLTYGLSGIIGPPAGGAIYDVTDSYGAALAASVLLLLVGAVLTWLGRGAMQVSRDG